MDEMNGQECSVNKINHNFFTHTLLCKNPSFELVNAVAR